MPEQSSMTQISEIITKPHSTKNSERRCPQCETPLKQIIFLGKIRHRYACDCMERIALASERKVEEGRRFDMLRKSGLNTGLYQQMSLRTWQDRGIEPAAYEYITGVELKSPNWLYLCGDYGTGKTHIAISILRQLTLDKGWRPAILRWAEASVMMAESWRDDEVKTAWIRNARNTTLLLIDDIDKTPSSESAMTRMYDLIEYRTVRSLPTIITANHHLTELESALGGKRDIAEAIVSRIWGNCLNVIEFRGKDFRKHGEV